MTRKELMEKINREENDLIETNCGLLDVLSVDDENVHYGFLASGKQMIESIADFLSHF